MNKMYQRALRITDQGNCHNQREGGGIYEGATHFFGKGCGGGSAPHFKGGQIYLLTL